MSFDYGGVRGGTNIGEEKRQEAEIKKAERRGWDRAIELCGNIAY